MDTDTKITPPAQTPDNAPPLLQQAETALRAGTPDAAMPLFARILTAQPRNAQALHGMGLALFASGKAAEAETFFARALEVEPLNHTVVHNHGMALLHTNSLFAAKSAFILATRLKPDYTEAWVHLAQTLMRLRENPEETERALARALSLNNAHPPALSLLATLRVDQKRFLDAAALYLRLADLEPKAKAEHTARAGICHSKRKDFASAATLFGKAATLAPDNGELLALHASALGECGQVNEAKSVFRRAAVAKGGKAIHRWKHLGFCPEFFPDAAAIDHYWDTLQRDLAEAVSEAPVFDWRTLPAEGFSGSFNLTHLGKDHRHVLEQYVRFFEKSFPFAKPDKRLRAGGRIRIGFFAAPMQGSGFFRVNSGIIRNLDPTQFECVLFYPQNQRQVFAPLQAPHVVHAPYAGSFEQLAQAIRAASLDILYHWKAGETPLTLFLPMCNLAPVQCTSWGTHATSGIRHVDYSLSWDMAEPENAQEHYTEKLVRLPAFPLLEPQPNIPPLPTRAQLGLPDKGTLFFCPHRMPKYHPDFDLYLRDILDNDPTAHILLLFESYLPSQELTRRRMLRNVGPKNARRLLFLPRTAPQRYTQFLAASDLVLGSPIYSTSLSGFDSLYLGKPVITQEGPRLLERYAIGHYRAMRIFDAPIARNREEYVQAALRLSRDADARKDLGERIRANAKVLMDTASIVAGVSDFYEQAAR